MNVQIPDLGEGKVPLCPLCMEEVESAAVELREVVEETTPFVSATPEVPTDDTYETVEAVVLSPCGHATHKYEGERPDTFLPWVYVDAGMSEEFERLQEILSGVEERFEGFEVDAYGQVGLLHDSQERPRPFETFYLRFQFEDWTVGEISELPYEANPVQIPKVEGWTPTKDWTSEPWSGLDPRTTVRTIYYVRYPEAVDV